MSEKPEALRLADIVERNSMFNETAQEAAAELRRLHQLALDQQGEIYALKMARSMKQKTATLKLAAAEAQRDALMKALKKIANDHAYFSGDTLSYARAAIAKAEEENT